MDQEVKALDVRSNVPVLTELLKESVASSPQIKHISGREASETILVYTIEENIVNIVQEGKRTCWKLGILTSSSRWTDSRMAWSTRREVPVAFQTDESAGRASPE